MVSEETDDGEGTLLERIRGIAPDLPIAVALDLHANLTPKMVENCTVIVGYKTYPHVDMYDTGAQAGRILIQALRGEIKPTMAWGNRPMLPHTLRMGTHEPPMKDLMCMAREAEEDGALSATVFGGFPLADIHDAGLSVVVVTNADQRRARTLCEDLLNAAWERRADFVYHSEPLTNSIARAKGYTEGPVLLIDHADNCASGGTQDTVAVLAEVIRQGLKDVAMAAIRDPEAVARLIDAGVGSRMTIQLGGKMDMPSIGMKGEPLEVTGVVRKITDGEFTIQGPMYKGVKAYMGRTVVLDTGAVEIIVIERNHEPWDLGVFRSVGIEPTTKRYLLLKSRLHYRAAFLPIAKHVIECDGIGVTTSEYSRFRFIKLRRPIYPLDLEAFGP
jgi:microcystin degradation protein MlrC